MDTPLLPLQQQGDDILDLPPGFRFHPTDEEIITCYLREKVMDKRFTAIAVAEVDFNKSEPWDLPAKAKMGEKEWYFFCQRDRKYPTGMRTNRATESGYWKATGKDKEIYKGKSSRLLIGMKKTLVFYKGRAPKGEKTNWVMHEYRLEGKLSYNNSFHKEEWVICRVFHKNIGGVGRSSTPLLLDSAGVDSFVEYILDSPSSLPCLMEMPPSSSSYNHPKLGTSSFANNDDYRPDHEFKYITAATDEIHSGRFFNNYYYKQNDHLLITPKREDGKSYGLFVPTHHIFTGNIENYYQHNNIATSSHCNSHQDETLVMNTKVSEFSSNNSMISFSHDTGLSNNQISSVVGPKQAFDRGIHFDGFEDQDLDSMWNY